MKGFGKWLAVIVAVVAVLVIAGVILVKVLVTPERVRATVLPMAEKELHRKISLGDIQISLFSGVRLADLKVAEREGEENFISAGEVVLRYRFWPLLAGRVVVDEVRLVDPRIRVARLADGSFNFSDLTAQPETPGAPAPAPEAKQAGGGIDLLVSEVAVSGGELVFLDYRIDPKAPYRLKLADLTAKVSDVSLERAFPFSVSATFGDSSLAADGEVDLSQSRGSAHVKVSGLDVTAFGPYLKNAVPGTLGGAHLSLDIDAAGGAQSVTSNGTVTCEQVDLVLDAMPDVPLRQVRLALDYKVGADLAAGKLTIDKGRVDFNGIVADVTGRVDDYAATPKLDLTLAVPDLDLRKSLDALPPQLVVPARDFDPAGRIEAKLRLVGSAEQPGKLLQEGTVRLADVQASVAGMRPALSGSLKLKGDSLSSEKLQLAAGDNEAAIDLRAGQLFGKPVTATLQVTSDHFAIDPLLAAGGAPAASGEGAKPQAAAGQEPGPFDLPLRLETTVKIAKATYKALAIDGIFLHALLDKNVLTIDRLDGQVAGGRFSDTARVDLRRKGLAYQTHLKLDGVQAAPLAAAFKPAIKDHLQGAMNLDTDLSGKGTTTAAIKRSLSGKGEILLKNGQLQGGAMVSGLASTLGLGDLRQLSFDQWDGNFRIENGQVLFDSRFNGNKVRLAPKGSVGLDGGLDVRLDARLSPELSQRLDTGGKVTRFFQDQQGWTQVPLKLGGTVDKPRFEIDARAAAEKAGQQLQQKLEKKLLEKIAPPARDGQEKDQTEKPSLEKTIRGLFGN